MEFSTQEVAMEKKLLQQEAVLNNRLTKPG
jgi:hypothetical protein